MVWPDGSVLGLFMVTALALVAVPGPNTLYIMARSMQQGLGAGLVSCLGVVVGTMAHILFAAFGISALVLSSVVAFNLLKYAGTAYFIYLGIKTIRTSNPHMEEGICVSNHGLGTVFYQGVAVNILNPKTALFFAAFLPQFIDIEKGGVAGQIVFLGIILITIGGLSDVTYAFLSGKLVHRLKHNRQFLTGRRYVAGGIYICLGMAAALSHQP